MNDNKVKIFEYLDILVKMCRSKGNGASLKVEEEDIYKKYKQLGVFTNIQRMRNTVEHCMNTFSRQDMEIIRLIKIRDELLPMLMNGQVSVK